MNNTNKELEEIAHEIVYLFFDKEAKVDAIQYKKVKELLTSYREQGVKEGEKKKRIELAIRESQVRIQMIDIIQDDTRTTMARHNKELNVWKRNCIETLARIDRDALTTQEDQLIVKE